MSFHLITVEVRKYASATFSRQQDNVVCFVALSIIFMGVGAHIYIWIIKGYD